jgi:hypothetical protein
MLNVLFSIRRGVQVLLLLVLTVLITHGIIWANEFKIKISSPAPPGDAHKIFKPFNPASCFASM